MLDEKTQRIVDHLDPTLHKMRCLGTTFRIVFTGKLKGNSTETKQWVFRAKIAPDGVKSFVNVTHVNGTNVFLADIFINAQLFGGAIPELKKDQKKETVHELVHAVAYMRTSAGYSTEIFHEIVKSNRREKKVGLAEFPEFDEVMRDLGYSLSGGGMEIPSHDHFCLVATGIEAINFSRLYVGLLLSYQLAKKYMAIVINENPMLKYLFMPVYRKTIEKLVEKEDLYHGFVEERMELFQRDLYGYFYAGLIT